jgi:hypothetical protein
MSDVSGFNDILAFSTRLQRRLFEGWAAAVGRGWHSPQEEGFRQPLEVGEEMVKLCLKLQGDLARNAMKAWDPRVNEHAPQVPGLDAAREAVEACLAYQERAWDAWFGAMRWAEPAPVAPDARLMEAATEWFQIWGKLAFEGLELQRRLIAGATPSETSDTPAPTRPKARRDVAAERQAA